MIATDYRPKRFTDVAGRANRASAKLIVNMLDNERACSFLFTGAPGFGKTTFARLVAGHLGAKLYEFDAGQNTGVDAIRQLMDLARTRPLNGGPKVIVLDECHMMSKQAWNALLKIVEEPPEETVWVFCTTEPTKVPKSIQSRCQRFEFGDVTRDELLKLVSRVAEQVDADLDDEVYESVVDVAGGNPRKALALLARVVDLPEINDEAIDKALGSYVDSESEKEAIDFCRRLNEGVGFRELAALVGKLSDKTSTEGVRLTVLNYFSKVAASNNWRRAASVLLAFGDPYPEGIGTTRYPILVSCASLFD